MANFDEDSVTMAVAAGTDCLRDQDRQSIDGLVFATTTPPYAEKQCAAIIAAALDLRRDIFSADLTDVLRAGTTALKSALDSVAAGSARKVLVIASDNRVGAPRGDLERNLGDGAAALLVSNEGVIADLEGSLSITENLIDSWRSVGDPFVRSWEDRFAMEEGLERVLGDAISRFLQQRDIGAGDVSKVALYAPNARSHAQIARQAGFASEQVQDPLFGRLGNTGAAFPLMLLVTALESARPRSSAADRVLRGRQRRAGIQDHRGDNGGGAPPGSERLPAEQDRAGQLRDLRGVARPLGVRRFVEEAGRQPSVGHRVVAGNGQEPAPSTGRRATGAATSSTRRSGCASIARPGTIPSRCGSATAPGRFSPTRWTTSPPAGTRPWSSPWWTSTAAARLLCMLTDRELDEVRVGMPVEDELSQAPGGQRRSQLLLEGGPSALPGGAEPGVKWGEAQPTHSGGR